jgi:hypothetical protein
MRDSPVLRTLAGIYAQSRAGRTGQGAQDKLVDFKQLLRAAEAEHGEERARAERDLELAGAKSLLELHRHPKDPTIIYKVRLRLENEGEFFAALGLESPEADRGRLSASFRDAARMKVANEWQERWADYFGRLEAAARVGGAIFPFSRTDLAGNSELSRITAEVLAWEGESLIRFVSCSVCGDSKQLQSLRGKIETILGNMSAGRVRSLQELGILETPRSCLLHGPVQLVFPEGLSELGLLRGPVRISEIDVTRALQVLTTAIRCITIENETTFYELAKLNSGELLVQTSYPGTGTLRFLERLPDSIQLYHFGDSDPKGFDILLDLRRRSARPIQSLHMRFRPADKYKLLPLDEKETRLLRRLLADPLMTAEHPTLEGMLAAAEKGRFEQEILGKPNKRVFPFYDALTKCLA